MKRLITLSLLCFYSISFAQNDSIIKDIVNARSVFSERELLVDLKEQHILRQERISKMIHEKKVPYNYFSKEGSYYELIDVYPDQTPIYYQTYNSRAGQLANIVSVQKGGKHNLNLSGKNVLIGVFDAIPTFKKHDEFKDRFYKVYIQSEVVPDDAPLKERRVFQMAQEHSTHVTGTIFAKGIEAEAKGLAPNVSLYSYNWRSDEINMLELAKNGALTSNHSYGTVAIGINGQLVVDSRLVGAYDWKAEGFDRVTSFYKNYLPVIAAGNNHLYASVLNPNGSEYNNLVGIAMAKNALLVGSLEQLGSINTIDNVNIVASSSYGPTKDFRIKPDVVAKGEGLYSTVNDYSKTEDHVIRTNRYGYLSGTSMATPVVTSLVALLQEWSKESFKVPLKAASVKAILIHTAYSLTLVYDKKTGKTKSLGEGPNPVYGWGAVDIDKAIVLLNNTSKQRSFLIEHKLETKNGKKYTISNDYVDNEIEATLVWTDQAFPFDYSHLSTNSYKTVLINDLDMRIKTKDKEYYPWALKKDMNNPIALEKDNDVDNLERITKKKLPKGESSLTIKSKSYLIPGGVQEYSLIISSKNPISITEVKTESYNAQENYRKDELLSDDINIVLWPNPVFEKLYISYDHEILILEGVYIYDLNGRIIKCTQDIKDDIISFDFINRGTYIIKIVTNKGVKTKYVVKK
ncbi:S8 family serine peptidase [Myroides odoratimimus]|uniref:S8 family serine peptidase n=1 Tax=Myroides odoratimimus TaxID=76832 RepID=UPI00046A4766|nr:S8 family serine peptidase [Myroides odoratimimus]